MMGARKRTKLGDLIETQKGYAFKSGWYCDKGRPIVKVSDFTRDSVESSNLVCIPETIAADFLKYELNTDDVVVQTVGSWPSNPASVVGKCVRIPNNIAGALLNQNAVKLSPQDGLDQRFLFYLLRSEDFKAYIIGTAQGAASQAAITLEAIRGYEFERPPLPIQRRIASILGVYDDLIEVNRRRIALLEKMAWRLFEEWFVHFRFPGHEGHTMIKSPNGLIPKGWRYARLDEVADVNNDTIGAANVPAQIYYVDISSVSRGEVQKFELMNFSDAPGRARRRVQDGSVIWSTVRPNRRSYALIHNPSQDLVVSTGFAVLDAREVSAAYLYHYTTTDVFVGYLVGNATGSAYPAVTGAAFERAAILVPDSDVDGRFNSIAEPILRLITTMQTQNTQLAASREFLLPRLISGDLSVSATECGFEAVA